tara:strand:+ start:290 stop:487 length:198 start_codon:yes stop_codon:yes gene_type:complete
MGKVKNFVSDVQEFVWDFFDEDGSLFSGTEIDVINKVIKEFGNGMAVQIAKDEIFDITTADHFSQ